MNYDIIVIGAGLGGLTAGAKLAREGKKVLLIEQHDRPGGCATTFERRDFTMEVGLHEMDGLHPGDLKTRIFRDLGIFERVEFLPLPEFYRFMNGRQDIVIPHDPVQAKQILIERFPGQEHGIEQYFHHVLNARKINSERGGGPEKSVGQFLDEIISDEDLKLVLLGNLGYFHDDPYTLSLGYYLTAQGSYYGGRANFIRGGSQVLSNALMQIIEEHGGTVKLKHLATGIAYEGKRPAGVTYENTRGKQKESHTDHGGQIIVNAAVPNLANTLLPRAEGKKLSAAISENRVGASLLTVYFGFNKPLKTLGNKYYSTFIYHPSVQSQADIVTNNHSDFGTRSFTFVDYSLVDSDLAPEGKSVGAACCVDYPGDWQGMLREEYVRLKSDVADIITERCEQFIPGFRDAVEYVEVATSLSVKRFTLNPGGAVYGFAQEPDKPTGYLSALPDNIHVASAWGKFGGGFSGAIFSGYMTAMNILRKR
ncbi:MAG TPA: NAD(P)/FAD-dependent oxidoreductase [Bacteroides sp.]|nr:NAD(P)/FAD-dependent oxidoreductase [Bacteroides sp.]